MPNPSASELDRQSPWPLDIIETFACNGPFQRRETRRLRLSSISVPCLPNAHLT